MYTIGEISKIVNVSANTLRYYDEIGLLKPSLIKDNNQYRYYLDTQIKDIIFIMELKQYGFKLYEIKELMKNRNRQKLKAMFEAKYVKLSIEIDRLKNTSILLEKRISEIIKEEDCKMKSGKILIVDDLELARIIMCSGMNNISIVLDSIKAGAKDFVSKLISNLSIINAITKSFEDNYKFNFKSIEYISEVLKNTGMDRPLKQGEINKFIQEIMKGNKDEEFIYNFLNQSNFDDKDNYENFINRQLIGIEEEILKAPTYGF